MLYMILMIISHYFFANDITCYLFYIYLDYGNDVK